MKLTYAKKILISATVIFLGVLALDIIFTSLLLNNIISINDKIKQLDISSKEREKELSLKDSIASSKVEREKLEGYFVQAGNAETVKFTKYLEDLALGFGLTQKKSLDYESINELQSSDAVSAIRFKFGVSGSWSQVYAFLRTIENLPKIVRLNSVGLTANQTVLIDGAGLKGNIWSADLDFSVAKLK